MAENLPGPLYICHHFVAARICFSHQGPHTRSASATWCSRTGSDRQLKRASRLDHSPYSEAKTAKRVEEFFGFSKFWIFADKRRSSVISNAVFGALFKLLAPSKNLHRAGGGAWSPGPPASTSQIWIRTCGPIYLVHLNWIWISAPFPSYFNW